jgi:hypothetical protein
LRSQTGRISHAVNELQQVGLMMTGQQWLGLMSAEDYHRAGQ